MIHSLKTRITTKTSKKKKNTIYNNNYYLCLDFFCTLIKIAWKINTENIKLNLFYDDDDVDSNIIAYLKIWSNKLNISPLCSNMHVSAMKYTSCFLTSCVWMFRTSKMCNQWSCYIYKVENNGGVVSLLAFWRFEWKKLDRLFW